MDIDIVKRFICGAKEAYKKVDNHSFNFPITIESAYRLATNIEKLLKEQEPVEPIKMQRMDGNFSFFVPYFLCGNCRYELVGKDVGFCSHCGKRVK